MEQTERKKRFIIDVIYISIIIGLFYLFFKFAFGMCLPFIVAIFIATVLQKPINAIMLKTDGKGRTFVSTVLALFCFVVMGTIVVLLIMKLISELKSFFDYLMLKLEDTELFISQITGWIESKLTKLPDGLRETLSGKVESVLQSVLGTAEKTAGKSKSFDFSVLATPLSALWGTAKQIPMIAVGIIVAIVSCCFLTADYGSFKQLILKISGEKHAVKIIAAKRILFSTVGKLLKAYCILIMITFTEMLLGLWILKLTGIYGGKYLFAVSLVTALVDILPVLGTGTILIPWGIYSLITGSTSFGIGIIVLYVVITVIRQAIEPKLVANQLGLPAYITIVAMYIGSQLFGFIGIFLMPISVMLVKVLNDEGIIKLFRDDNVDFERLNAEVDAKLHHTDALADTQTEESE